MRRGWVVDRERVLALLWLVGAALTFLTLVLPYPAEIDETARIVVALLALGVGVALLVGPELTDAALHGVLAAGVAAIAFCSRLGVPETEGVMFVLIVVYVFGTFRPRVGAAYLAGIGGAYAIALATQDDGYRVVPEVAWTLVMGVSALVGASMALMVSLRDRERERRRRDRQIAGVLQRALLPESLPSGPGFQLAARYLPASREADVGGDLYDAIELADGRLALAIGDVAGKGLPAAAVVGRVRAALRAYAVEDPSPARVLDRLDAFLSAEPEAQMVTLLYLLADPATGRLLWSSAGHPPALRMRPDAPPEPMTGRPGPPLGVGARHPHPEHTGDLRPGDQLLLYTDGLVERRGAPIDEGVARVAGLLADLPVRDAEYTLHAVLRQVAADRFDDAAVVLFGLVEPAAAGAPAAAAEGLGVAPA